MNTNEKIVNVGVGVLIIRNDRVLLGERQGSHGAGTWALPGGHLEFGETVAQCAAREVREETGLRLQSIEPAPYTNDFFEAQGKHCVTLFVLCTDAIGKPATLEPEKCVRWAWFRWSELPAPLFLPLQTLVESGYVPGPSA